MITTRALHSMQVLLNGMLSTGRRTLYGETYGLRGTPMTGTVKGSKEELLG